MNNPGRVSDDAVGVGRLEIYLRQPFHHLVGKAHRDVDRKLQGRFINHTQAVRAGDLDPLFGGSPLDLPPGAMHDYDPHVQRAQHRDIQKDVGKIFRGKNVAVNREHEKFIAKVRDVLEDAAELRKSHVMR